LEKCCWERRSCSREQSEKGTPMEVPGGQKAEGGEDEEEVEDDEVGRVAVEREVGKDETADVVGRPKVGVMSSGSVGRGGSVGASGEEELVDG